MIENGNRPRPTGIHREVDLEGEYLFYDIRGEKVHVLNGTARSIYRLCDGTRTADEIARELTVLYDVDDDTAIRDVRRTMAELVGLDILSLS